MLELIIGIMAIAAVVKIAAADGQNTALVTFVLVAACVVLIPLPMLPVGIGARSSPSSRCSPTK